MMNIYLISIPEEFVKWDCYHGHVIAAMNREEVVKLAKEVAADEGDLVWEQHHRVELLATNVKHEWGIILSSFNAG